MKEETSSRKTAVALRYRVQEDQAPRVVAQGRGTVAEQILALAREHNIPIYEDAVLVETLARLEPGKEIPPALYQVVAEILAFVYSLDRRRAGTPSP
ncbi:MAG: flagellar biosynthesis [Nitrospinota bacterium]|nr:MAG: flagellar biosynthesis [Nitrospinota bacterium]